MAISMDKDSVSSRITKVNWKNTLNYHKSMTDSYKTIHASLFGFLPLVCDEFYKLQLLNCSITTLILELLHWIRSDEHCRGIKKNILNTSGLRLKTDSFSITGDIL